MIEVPCHVDAIGAHPIAGSRLLAHGTGPVCSVKAVARSVIQADTAKDRTHAVKALTVHPLIDSYAVAKRLLDACRRHFPELNCPGR